MKPIEVMTLDELAEYDASLRQRIVTLDIKTRQDASRITELDAENKRLREALSATDDFLTYLDRYSERLPVGIRDRARDLRKFPPRS